MSTLSTWFHDINNFDSLNILLIKSDTVKMNRFIV